MQRSDILALMGAILKKQGRSPDLRDEQSLRDAGFRSLDFSELALRVEMATGKTLNFDAGKLRQITTVGDVVRFFESAAEG